jgi:transcription initiation factor TFIIA large subunit
MAQIFENIKRTEQVAEDSTQPANMAEDDEEAEEEESLCSDDETNTDYPEATDFLIASHEKVHRTKRRWRCNLQNCVLKIDGRDFVFSQASGDFEF